MTSILDRIDRPQDLHDLSEDELQQVAQEVRELLIDTVGEIGGHFGANLGTCELAVALQSLAQDAGVSLSTVLLAAFQALLARYSGQSDIVVGAVGGGAQAHRGLRAHR